MYQPLRRRGSVAAGAAVLLAAGVCCSSLAMADGPRIITYLVKQDWSDCSNANVPPQPDPAQVGGEAMVTLRDGGQTQVNIRLTRAAPNTTYHLFLKCHYLLGDIKTGANGRGNNTFFFKTSDSGPIFAFDMYPDGAPLGNKYQSVQLNFAAAATARR